jgi:hypothetical protein
MVRIVGSAFAVAAIVAIVSADAPGQPPATRVVPQLISEMPAPKVGDKLTLDRSEVKMQKDDDGLLEVVDMIPGKEQTVTITLTEWDLDADGWFDKEGFNLTKAYPRSGLWAMRSVKGNRPLGSGSGLPSSPTSLVPQTPPRLYRAGPGDIITHIDGIAVTSYPRYVYAINNASNTRDIPLVVMSGANGRRHLHFITAYKVLGQ